MTETNLDIKIVGNYVKAQADPGDCLNCGAADYGDVIINGICGQCLLGELKNYEKDHGLHCGRNDWTKQEVVEHAEN